MMYHCDKCHKETKLNLSPFEFKCALNPDLAVKPEWGKEDWNRPIGFCLCGGEIKAGSYREPYYGQISGEHKIVNVAMGCHPDQVPEMLEKFPDSEYDSDGNLITKGFRHQVREAERRGYVVK